MNHAATVFNTAKTTAKDEQFIPLSQLVLSPHNVRSPDMNERELDELGASIMALGLIQNLSVHPLTTGKKSQQIIYGVCAGGNRLYALNRLQKAGLISAEYGARCRVINESRALEISLAENIVRKNLSPVDQFYAFQRLIDKGEHIDDVAAVFGVSPVVVKRSLALAKLAPTLLEQCRRNEIKLSQLMVLTLIPTHEQQIEFWENLNEYQRDPETMRHYLTEQRIDASSHPLAKFIGVSAYIKAGGAVETDLFNDNDNAGFMLDAALLDSIVLDRLEEIAEGFRLDGWLWAEPRLEFTYQDSLDFTQADHTEREPNDDEKARQTQLQAELQALQDLDEMTDAQNDRWDEINAALEAIDEGLRTYDADAKAKAGVIITVADNGLLSIDRGLIRRADKTASAKTTNTANAAADANTPAEKTKPSNDYSEAMYRRLSAHRTRALQASVAGNPSVALALLAYRIGSPLLYPREFISCSAQIRIESSDLGREADDIEKNAGTAMLNTARDVLKAQLPKKVSAFLPWLLTQPANVITDILAYCTALSINDVHNNDKRNGDTDLLAQAVGLDMANYWTATADSFFNHVTKRHALDALKSVSKKSAEDSANLKKDAIAREAEKQLDGKRWLPKALQFKRKK